MKTTGIILCLLITVASGMSNGSQPGAENNPGDHPLVGSWKFISIKATSEEGVVNHFYGEKPFGRLFYTGDGNMSVLLMDPDRPRFKSDDLWGGTDEEIKTAYYGFDAYCGRYSVNQEEQTVTHHLQGSKYPNWVGSEQVRHFKLKDQKLFLTATIPAKGTTWFFEAVLVKL